MKTTASDFGGSDGGTSPREVRIDPARRTFVERIGTQLAAGTYDPPLDRVIDSLVVALLPAIRVGR